MQFTKTKFTDQYGEYCIIKAVRFDIQYDVMVDECDYDKYSQYRWHISKRGYVQISRRIKGKMKSIKLHRMIMQVNDPNIKVDHIDGNKLNCRRYNLRACTNQQNGFNTGTYKNNTSGVKGVSWNKNIKRWQPKIMVDGRTINLGVFKENEFELAVKARKDAEIKYFGEFRRENNEHI